MSQLERGLFEIFCYIASSMGCRVLRNLLRSTLGNNGSAAVTAFRTDINNVICRLNDIQVMLNHNYSITAI